MSTGTSPASAGELLDILESTAGLLADLDAAALPAVVLGDSLAGMERLDAVLAAARSGLLAAFDATDGHLADGQRTLRAWAVNVLGVTKGQAGEYLALRGLARDHAVLRAGLRDKVVPKSLALQLARWTRDHPRGVPAQGRGDLCAARRPVVFPVQPGGIRRIFLGLMAYSRSER